MAHDRLLRAVGSDIYWYVRNGKDVVGTIESDGKKQNNTYAYTAYGKDIDINSPTSNEQLSTNNSELKLSDNPFKYSATYQDFESDLYYMKARYYSPELMRFISKDTYDLSNKYAYANGNPISNYDPSGHNALSFTLSLIGLVVSAIATVVTFGSASPSMFAAGMAFVGLVSGAAGTIEGGIMNSKTQTANGGSGWDDWSWKSEDTLSNVFNIIGVVADVAAVGSILNASTARVFGGKGISSKASKVLNEPQRKWKAFGATWSDAKASGRSEMIKTKVGNAWNKAKFWKTSETTGEAAEGAASVGRASRPNYGTTEIKNILAGTEDNAGTLANRISSASAESVTAPNQYARNVSQSSGSNDSLFIRSSTGSNQNIKQSYNPANYQNMTSGDKTQLINNLFKIK